MKKRDEEKGGMKTEGGNGAFGSQHRVYNTHKADLLGSRFWI